MDNLTYNYYANTNRLLRVTDNTGYSSYYSEDVDHQAATSNYAYDNTGNLTVDAAEKITNISWTVYGKIASIVKNGATISYSYDAAGNRITKTAGGITTLYVRDASGNVMSVYELPAAEQLVQKEVHLYGSSRIGIVKVDNEVVERTPLPGGGEMVIRKFTRGNKFFETTNHLGNVLATLTDRKLLQSSTEQTGLNNGGCQPGTAVEELTVMQRSTASQFTARTAVYLEAGFETVDAVDELEVNTSTQQGSCVVLPPATISNGQAWYVADVVSATDYAPGGMQLSGRVYQALGSVPYRYGAANGQEKSIEINENSYTAEFWQYDARLVRRWNVDPVKKEYESPYAVFANNPIWLIDVNGADTTGPRTTPQKGGCEKCKVEELKDGDYFSDVQDQTFTASFSGITQESFDKFKTQMKSDPGKIVNNRLATYSLIDRDGSNGVSIGDHFDIDIYGPDNGFVLVDKMSDQANSLSVTVLTLEEHPDAGQNTFMTSYDPRTKTMTWTTHNISRTNDFITQGVGAGVINARGLQQKQWGKVIRTVWQYMGEPEIKIAKSLVVEYDYNDYTNKIGKEEYRKEKDLKEAIKKPM